MEDYKPSPYFTWSVHLDGLKEEHDKAVCQEGVFDRCVSAIKKQNLSVSDVMSTAQYLIMLMKIR